MQMHKKNIFLLTVLVIFTLFFVGCTAAKKPAPTSDDRASENYNNTGKDVEDPEKNPYQSQPASNDQALKISQNVDDVDGVVKASVVVSGGTAYIGVYTNSNMNINEADLKQRVDKKVRENNANIKSVYISTDPNTINRLREINRGIADGKPSSTYDLDTLFK